MLETLRAGPGAWLHPSGVDLDTLADRLCSGPAAHQPRRLPATFAAPTSCRRSVAASCSTASRSTRRRDATLDRSEPLRGGEPARSKNGRRSTRTRTSACRCCEPSLAPSSDGGATRRPRSETSPPPPASAPAACTGLIGSKDELLGSIMRSFTVTARSAWKRVLEPTAPRSRSSTRSIWINLNARRPVQRRVQHPARLDAGVAAEHDQPRLLVLGSDGRPQVAPRPRAAVR